MMITGEALIGGLAVKGSEGGLRAFNPATLQYLEPEFHTVGPAQIELACDLAGAAFDAYRATSDEQRAVFLDTIGRQLMELGDALVERVMAESGLPRARVEGERARSVGQLKLFAQLLREGSWSDLRVDPALPERQPPRADLRMRMIGLGPVAVFAASNFPLAFSVAGGDTASALAAGCPVVLKAHSAHPGTSELVGRAIVKAAALCGMPAGVFALLTGSGNGIGQALVAHPAIQAVGFTGSRSGGLALMAVAAARPQPIPVYAEMSSINPVFLLPHALAARAEEIAAGFAVSLTLGVGQMCTNPGLLLALDGADLERFKRAAAQALEGVAAGTMLSPGIAENFLGGVHKLADHADVATLALAPQQGGKGAPALFATSGAAFLARRELADEVFGPAALVVACRDLAELRQVADSLEGQLTATLQLEPGDYDAARQLLPVLERKVGRILANGFPTGVEVASAMVHGGPFPSTSDGRSTSVGTTAIARFLRPVSYQNLPQALLPAVLRDDKLAGSWRRVDGELTRQ
ncbi:aldehyde dehydrogenase (NADP(+)) [Rugamonas sp. CCM 8940]|uniref:aldehyde dehydrogenase (NADP(+)) n=1 Tax=Rugamonas sp. CCM 8940 TaxID=2765359 RepID=UPI0018F5ED63|nr:aldehyde dehydrogenase (NADP(+)) [Rugamonas sp. CCM 8940]MBJ7312682.1 aldehyde dehydrogenase (NADP(+)) [Rugamonas sp. CCM 8940]